MSWGNGGGTQYDLIGQELVILRMRGVWREK
jgi:hypothetical protein